MNMNENEVIPKGENEMSQLFLPNYLRMYFDNDQSKFSEVGNYFISLSAMCESMKVVLSAAEKTERVEISHAGTCLANLYHKQINENDIEIPSEFSFEFDAYFLGSVQLICGKCENSIYGVINFAKKIMREICDALDVICLRKISEELGHLEIECEKFSYCNIHQKYRNHMINEYMKKCEILSELCLDIRTMAYRLNQERKDVAGKS